MSINSMYPLFSLNSEYFKRGKDDKCFPINEDTIFGIIKDGECQSQGVTKRYGLLTVLKNLTGTCCTFKVCIDDAHTAYGKFALRGLNVAAYAFSSQNDTDYTDMNNIIFVERVYPHNGKEVIAQCSIWFKEKDSCENFYNSVHKGIRFARYDFGGY